MGDEARRRLLVLGDLTPILLFALIGGATHDGGFSFFDFLRNVSFLGVGWFVAALALRPYASPGAIRLAGTWALGITAGVFLRAAALGRAVDREYLVFWCVALVTTLVFLVVWRLLERVLARSLDTPASG